MCEVTRDVYFVCDSLCAFSYHCRFFSYIDTNNWPHRMKSHLFRYYVTAMKKSWCMRRTHFNFHLVLFSPLCLVASRPQIVCGAFPSLLPLRVADHPILSLCATYPGGSKQKLKVVHGELIKVVPGSHANSTQKRFLFIMILVDCISLNLTRAVELHPRGPLHNAFDKVALKIIKRGTNISPWLVHHQEPP